MTLQQFIDAKLTELQECGLYKEVSFYKAVELVLVRTETRTGTCTADMAFERVTEADLQREVIEYEVERFGFGRHVGARISYTTRRHRRRNKYTTTIDVIYTDGGVTP